MKVKEYLEKNGLETSNTDNLDDEVVKVEETDSGTLIYTAPGYYIIATPAGDE